MPNSKVMYICRTYTLLDIHCCLPMWKVLPGLYLTLFWQGCCCGEKKNSYRILNEKTEWFFEMWLWFPDLFSGDVTGAEKQETVDSLVCQHALKMHQKGNETHLACGLCWAVLPATAPGVTQAPARDMSHTLGLSSLWACVMEGCAVCMCFL